MGMPEVDKKTRIGIAVACFLGIIVIILACLFGEEINCYSFEDEHFARIKAMGPPMVHYPNIKNTKLIKLSDTPADAHMKTIAFSKVPGKEMQATVMRLNSGPALTYTHWYESILFVMDGSFTINNGTAKTITLAKEQSLFIPRGSVISYTSTAASSFMYIVSQPPTVPRATAIQAAIGRNPTNIGYPGMAVIKAASAMAIKTDLAFFGDAKGGDLSYLTDFLFSTVKGAGMTGGLYKLLKGPHLDYTYPYEEFKYILAGEFHLTDGHGTKVVAKAGDLMYFPNGCPVRFEGATTGLQYGYGFFVGQRAVGEA